MRIKLGWKLGITYLILIVLSMGVFGYFTMQFFQQSYINEKKSASFTHASILATSSVPFLRSGDQQEYLHSLAREHGERVGSRFLILDRQGEVVADSAEELTGSILGYQEVRTALRGENSATPYLENEFGWVLYLAVPVYSGKQVIGAVFMSEDINPLVTQLDDIRGRLYYFSALTGVTVFLISLFLGTFLTRPIKTLIYAARRLAGGDYGYQVTQVNRKDEIGELTTVFNDMSTKIKAEDALRRQFIANASHELRSPVAALKALLQSRSLNDTLSRDDMAELLNDLSFEADRLEKLVEDLLVLSRLEGDRQQIRLEETSVGELIEAVKRAVLPLAKSKKVVLEAFHDGDLYWRLDGEKVFRALVNLADNAIKYTPPEGKVTLGFKHEESKLILYVSDTGEGIPNDEIPHIFERFYRVDKARSRKTGGWGLGLAIVKEIVDLHKGKIKVESVTGRETTFTVEIPSEI